MAMMDRPDLANKTVPEGIGPFDAQTKNEGYGCRNMTENTALKTTLKCYIYVNFRGLRRHIVGACVRHGMRPVTG